MYRVRMRFYEELNAFLPRDRHKREHVVEFADSRSVKDLVEAQGVPHTEIDMILVNGEPVGFDRLVADGDRISVYPVFESFDVSGLSKLGRPPLRHPRFVADVHMGKLVRLLRLLGLDCLYWRYCDDDRLAEISHTEKRILLTRDKGLLKRSLVDHGIYLHSDEPEAQAVQVVRRVQLQHAVAPGTRCLTCNGLLAEASVDDVREDIPLETATWYTTFHRCRSCGQIYWRGAHWQQLMAQVDRLLDAMKS